MLQLILNSWEVQHLTVAPVVLLTTVTHSSEGLPSASVQVTALSQQNAVFIHSASVESQMTGLGIASQEPASNQEAKPKRKNQQECLCALCRYGRRLGVN
jgi:hypothetical protein